MDAIKLDTYYDYINRYGLTAHSWSKVSYTVQSLLLHVYNKCLNLFGYVLTVDLLDNCVP